MEYFNLIVSKVIMGFEDKWKIEADGTSNLEHATHEKSRLEFWIPAFQMACVHLKE